MATTAPDLWLLFACGGALLLLANGRHWRALRARLATRAASRPDPANAEAR